MKRIAVGVCGIGQGHSIRQSVIVDGLRRTNARVVLFVFGTSAGFFARHYPDVPRVSVRVPWVHGNGHGIDYRKTAEDSGNHLGSYIAENFAAMDQETQIQVLQFVQHTGLDEELKLRVYRLGIVVGAPSAQTEAIWQLRNLKLHDPIRALKWAMSNSRGAVREAAAEAIRQLQEEVA